MIVYGVEDCLYEPEAVDTNYHEAHDGYGQEGARP